MSVPVTGIICLCARELGSVCLRLTMVPSWHWNRGIEEARIQP